MFLQRLVTDPSSLPGYATLKYSPAGEVCRARMEAGDGALEVVCKQSRATGFFSRQLARLRQSRAGRHWQRARMLLRNDISTPQPLALIEQPAAQSWLVTEVIPDVVDLDQVVLVLLPQVDPRRVATIKRHLLEALVGLYVRFDECNLHHRDLKASNLLITRWDGTGGEPRVWLVDLDGLVFPTANHGRNRRQRLVRLAASLIAQRTLTRADFARFLRLYRRRAGLDPRGWKMEWRTLAPRVLGYNRRAKGRKRGKLDGFTD
jgi:hypothetical protein